MTIDYQFVDVDAHGATIRAQAMALEPENQAIIVQTAGRHRQRRRLQLGLTWWIDRDLARTMTRWC